MPKTKPLTKEEQEKQARELLAERVRNVLWPYKDRTPLYEIAHLAGLSASVVQRRWRGEVPWELYELSAVCDVLGVPEIERARLIGGVKR